MRELFKRGLVAVVSVFVVAGLSLSYVNAQSISGSGNGFRISPVNPSFTIEKGKSQILTINIENPTDIKTIAQITINDFESSDDEDGVPKLILEKDTPAPKNSFKNLVKPIDDIVLGPREKKDIPVTISVPTDAGAGGYYGAILFVPAPVSGSGNVGLTASVGTIVLVKVPGDLKEQLDLVQLSAGQNSNAKSFFTKGDVGVVTRLKNSGDIHVQPFGKVQIKNMFGKVIYEYEFNNTEPRGNVLPDSTRKFFDNIPNRRWLGRYTIVINVGYSQGGGELISSNASFWYIPTVLLYLIVLVLLALVGSVYWFIRRTKARRLHKHDVNKKRN